MHAAPLLFALALVPGPRAAAAQGEDPVRALAERLEEERDGVDLALFEDLARLGDERAYRALSRAAERVIEPPTLDAAYTALARFQSHPDLAQDARRRLLRAVRSKDRATRRAAVLGLAHFGADVHAELEELAAEHDDPRCRARALGGLLDVLRARATGADPAPGEAALALLLAQFRVPESGARADLAFALGAFTSAAHLTHMARRLEFGANPLLHPDPNVDLAIVDALSARGDAPSILALEAALFARLLPEAAPGNFARRDADDRVASAALAALVRRDHFASRDPLTPLLRAPYPGLRKDALVAYAALTPDAEARAHELFALGKSPDVALRKGAAAALAKTPGPIALEALHGLSRDPIDAVRFEVYSALGARREKRAIPLLIERVGAEPLALRWSPYRELRRLTGRNLGLSTARWKHWWKGGGADMPLPTLEEALAADREREARAAEGTRATEFFGLSVSSSEVVLVLDLSGSMAWPSPVDEGESRFTALVRQLVTWLGHYPDGYRFNLVFFAGEARAFAPRMVELNAETRADALRFVWRQEPAGGTALYAGLDLALEDPDVADVYLLSDGEPTVGELTSTSRILRTVKRRLEHRKVRIHGVSIGDQGADLLEGLSEVTGGGWIGLR